MTAGQSSKPSLDHTYAESIIFASPVVRVYDKDGLFSDAYVDMQPVAPGKSVTAKLESGDGRGATAFLKNPAILLLGGGALAAAAYFTFRRIRS